MHIHYHDIIFPSSSLADFIETFGINLIDLNMGIYSALLPSIHTVHLFYYIFASI